MTDQTTTTEAPTGSGEATPSTTTIPDLHAFAAEVEQARAERQADAEAAAEARVGESLADVAKREREAFAKATALTTKAPGYVERYAAYDSRRLAFIEGAIGDTAKAARDAAKALGHEGDHIETRKV